MGFSLNEMKEALVREREMVRAFRAGIKDSLRLQKKLRADIRSEMQINRVVKADARAATKVARVAKREERMAARIAKAEARLQALRDKANSPKLNRKNQRKASPVTVWTAEQIAAMNAERGVA
jgi:hypothetical protein